MSEPGDADERFFRPAPAPPLPEDPADRWRRLSSRVVWVDLVQVVVALLPAGIALAIGIDSAGGGLWPLVGIAAFGVIGAVTDAIRWLFTRYRVTGTHVELRTGVLFRVHRSIQRDRIRSVDAEARLRHRLAALRVLEIGAGQQSAARESALKLDALSREDAYALRHELLDPAARVAAVEEAAEEEAASDAVEDDQPIAVFWRFDPRWVIFHVLSIWSYVVVLGIGWGANFFLETFGIDVVEILSGLLDWDAIGTVGTVAIAFVAATIGGVLALGVAFVTEYWGYELARVRGRNLFQNDRPSVAAADTSPDHDPNPQSDNQSDSRASNRALLGHRPRQTTTDSETGSNEGTLLRTRRGLFTTREVNRAEHRIRGVRLSEPLLWRWIGATDTTVITTGLSLWAIDQPTAILPRGPIGVHRRVAAEVLDPDHAPLAADLATHPRAALRRRLWWGTLLTLGVGAVLVWLLVTDVVPAVALAGLVVLWPLALAGGLVAYRALGHAIVGPYLVARSGLASRATTVLRRDAVSTIVVRESLFQRRLGLRTVATMTAAGAGKYQVPDLTRDDALRFADRAAPGLLDPFLVRDASVGS